MKLNNWTEQNLPNDLIIAKNIIYNYCSLKCSQPTPELESIDYDAYRFSLNTFQTCYRKAKITPTKTGQVVTLWKRNKSGIIEPFDFLDPIDLVIICVRKENYLGQFIFPKTILLEKEIFSTNTREGKRAMRIYPPWDKTSSKQAQKTQEWQLNYFFEVSIENSKLISDFLHDITEKT